MTRRGALLGPGLAAAIIVASCGARTGLEIPIRPDATVSNHPEAGARKDATFDAQLAHDAHPLDVKLDCSAPPYCNPDDPNYIYQCGVPIYQCSSLQQCEERCGDGGILEAGADASGCQAECINPCLDTLGQDSSSGCEFYAAEMDTTDEAKGSCYAVFVVNQWKTGQTAQIAVDLDGVTLPIEQFARMPSGTGRSLSYAPYVASQGIAQNEIAILFLSRDPAAAADPDPTDPRTLASCPDGVTPAVVGDAALHGTGIGTAFHIRSNVPIVAYQMLPYGGGRARVTGATLLLPVNVWGTNYLAANTYHYPAEIVPDGSTAEVRAGPSMAILAQANNTHVTIDPVTAIVAGTGVAGASAGQSMTYVIDKGQYLQFTQQEELSGSAVVSDNPVAIIGGSTLMDIPVTLAARADHGEQMIPPVQALGSEYVGVRYRTRDPSGAEESVPWRIMGVVDGTTLTFDPPQTGAPTTVSAHQVLEWNATGPFVVSSQDASHPFYFAQYMTGGGPYDGVGDPECVNVISPKQFLRGYTFFTDPTYPETNLVLVRVQDAASGQFPDVRIECSGLIGGWGPVGTHGKYQFTRFDLSTGNWAGQNGCNNGVHTISGSFPVDAGSSTPMFGVTVWGWGNTVTDPLPDDAGTENDPRFTRWVSYGYPAGANIVKLNDVFFPAR